MLTHPRTHADVHRYEMGKDEVWSWTDALGSIHLVKLDGTNKVRPNN